MRISAKLLILEILALLVFAILAGVGFLAWRLSQGPIDLEWIKPQIERSLADARGGQPVKIDNLVLEWVRDRGRVEAVARGFTALDKTGHVAFEADRAMIALDAGALLTLNYKTKGLRMEKGVASVVRSKAGVWTLADMVLAKEPEASDKPFDPVRDINWATLATPIRALISAGDFERVELANFRLDVDDQKSGTKWSATPVSGVWEARKEGVELQLDATLAGALAGEPNQIRIGLKSNGDVTAASGRMTLSGVDPMSIAKMFGYTGTAFASGKPASATFEAQATEKGGLQSTELSLSGVTGTGTLGGETFNVANLAFDAAYDPATKHIALEKLTVASDKLTGEFTGSMDATAIMTGDKSRPTPFKLSGTGMTVNLQPVFDKTWQFESADIDASLSPDLSRVTIANIKAVTEGLNAAGQGEVWFEGPAEKMQIGVKGSAVGTGKITPQQVTAFWPVGLGEGARQWVKTRIPQGTATKAVFSVNWPPGATAKGYLPDDALALEFTVADATVKFLDDYPAVTGVSGVGHMKGNSLSIDISGGHVGNWVLDEGGHVILPRFAPGGAVMDVALVGHGGLTELMSVLDQTNLKVSTRYGLAVDQMKGDGTLDIHIQNTMNAVMTEKDIAYTVNGLFHGAAAPDLVAGFGLADSNVNFELTQDGIAISGNGNFGPAPVVFDWKERFKPGSQGAELTATARATPDLLNAFGLAARNFMQGEAAVDLHASGPGGREFSAITANVDLTHAQLDLGELGWRKKYDAPAKGSFRYGKDDSGAVLTGDIRADGLELVGEAKLDNANAVQNVDIERIFSRDNVDLRGALVRRQDGGYRLSLNGPFFDASPWMDTALDFSGGKGGGADAVGGPGDPGPVFDLQLNADKLRLRPNADLLQAKVLLSLDGEGPRSATITGNIAKGKALNVALTTKDDVRNISVRADDAGFAARVLLKADYLIGGKLAFDGKFEGSDGDANITMNDVRLKDAPLVAQIFSLASLQGLADVLSGEGVMFTDVTAPIKLVDGRIDLPGMRASGPAMGFTARGWIAPEDNELALDGVLVPSFGVNSLLGGIPIIGDLFVSRQGEGMFAPTYSVRGTFTKARVAINPVSAFTPGVLRRIFENPSEPPPPSDAATPPPAAQAKR